MQLSRTLCHLSLFRDSSCRNLCFWPHNGFQELGARLVEARMDRGTDCDRVQVDPVQPALAASSHPCLLKDHGREPESLISSGRGSLLAGFHPGIPCSFFPGGTVPVIRYLWEAQVLRHS